MEISPEVIALCASAGALVANSMTSDLYEVAKGGLRRMIRRDWGSDRQVERLERDRQAVVAAGESTQSDVINKVATGWATRFEDLVEEHPEVAAELGVLVRQLELAGATNVMANNAWVNQRAGHHGQNIYSGRDTNTSKLR
ncbi:hypothetical protein ABZ403_21845 [Micromonospora zamorensis]|uniref:hypothetical protein n=1 Tax=Micromonospora zamorensis TaxID=709883 RepID=UPI003408A209